MKLSYAIKLLADAGVPDATFDARELFETVGGVPRFTAVIPSLTARSLSLPFFDAQTASRFSISLAA